MKSTLEYEIVQNDALAALILWQFVASFYEERHGQSGPTLPLLMPVLALIFNKETAESLYKRKIEGGLYRAIAEDRTIPVGLQYRMEVMSNQTFQGLNIAFASGLLNYLKEKCELIPVRTTPPFKIADRDTRIMLGSAKRLGIWFASLEIDQLCVLLKVRF